MAHYGVHAVAADKAGNVYVACKVGDEDTGRIFRLAAGATAGDELPFPGLKAPERIAVDAAGNVFVAESLGGVRELPAGASSAVELPVHVRRPTAVAVDSAGNVDVGALATREKTDRLVSPGQVLKLAPDK